MPEVKNKEMLLGFVMMVGLPGCGKTTWIRKHLASVFNQEQRKTVVASSDNYIELIAMEQMKTYNQVFKEHAKDAMKYCLDLVEQAVTEKHHIIWDQTNLSRAGRKTKLAMIPPCYYKKAVVIHCPDPDTWKSRLDGRPGKIIPTHVLHGMGKSLETPTLEEGFDDIEIVFT